MAILVLVIILIYNYQNKFDSFSIIQEEKFFSETRVVDNEKNLQLFFDALKNQRVICRRVGCTNIQDGHDDDIIEISFSLLNLFIKFEGSININSTGSPNEVIILIDGELQFTSDSYKSPVKLATEIKAAWENNDNKESIFLESKLESQIIGFAERKLGSAVTISTLESIQSNLISRLLNNNI